MRLTEEETNKITDLFTPAELIEALDLESFDLLHDLFNECAEEIREILKEY